jgi:hypothetical protein
MAVRELARQAGCNVKRVHEDVQAPTEAQQPVVPGH